MANRSPPPFSHEFLRHRAMQPPPSGPLGVHVGKRHQSYGAKGPAQTPPKARRDARKARRPRTSRFFHGANARLSINGRDCGTVESYRYEPARDQPHYHVYSGSDGDYVYRGVGLIVVSPQVFHMFHLFAGGACPVCGTRLVECPGPARRPFHISADDFDFQDLGATTWWPAAKNQTVEARLASKRLPPHRLDEPNGKSE